MKKISATICFVMLVFVAESFVLYAQAREGTVESSWNRAPSHGDVYRGTPVVPPKAPPLRVASEPVKATAWDATPGRSTKPWPVLPANPSLRDYHEANVVVIDSLSHLYCLSPGYVTTLRSRNEEAWQGLPQSNERDFNYNDGGNRATREVNRPSLQALYKELMQLLDRCLAGR